ncbi:hypothetical protein BT69DRAFT_1279148 [Atractiella rhizophila]|nr:hypothetical protein BT69DRAFT_1279148 [Atractiella rhizophila]
MNNPTPIFCLSFLERREQGKRGLSTLDLILSLFFLCTNIVLLSVTDVFLWL